MQHPDSPRRSPLTALKGLRVADRHLPGERRGEYTIRAAAEPEVKMDGLTFKSIPRKA